MNKIQQRIQLLSLLSIFFIYRIIVAKNTEEFSLWFMITLVYLISLVIMWVVFRGYKEKNAEQQELLHKRNL